MRPYILPLALLFIAFTVPCIAQNVAEVVVPLGAPFAVECTLGVTQRAEWRVNGAPPPPDMRGGGERALPGGGGLRARLETSAAAPRHVGLYTCAPGPAPPPAARVRLAAINGTNAEAETTQAPPGAGLAGAGLAGGDDDVATRVPVLYDLYKSMDFNCSGVSAGDSNYQWFINGTAVSGDTKAVKLLGEGGSRLLVVRAGEADFGNYTCRVGGVVAGAWEASARPLAWLQANTNVVEGQKFVITCKLVGKPYEAVTWNFTKDTSLESVGEALHVGDNTQFSVRDSPAGVPAGTLEGRAATRDDAGKYTCVSPRGGASASSTLRVKDVYAALWPFLGICLEVFILCAIILVYEKRRTKPELDDSDADAHDQKKS